MGALYVVGFTIYLVVDAFMRDNNQGQLCMIPICIFNVVMAPLGYYNVYKYCDAIKLTETRSVVVPASTTEISASNVTDISRDISKYDSTNHPSRFEKTLNTTGINNPLNTTNTNIVANKRMNTKNTNIVANNPINTNNTEIAAKPKKGKKKRVVKKGPDSKV